MGQIKKSRQKYISKRYQNNIAETVVSIVRTWIENLSESLTQVSSSIQQPISIRQPTLPPFSPSIILFTIFPRFQSSHYSHVSSFLLIHFKDKLPLKRNLEKIWNMLTFYVYFIYYQRKSQTKRIQYVPLRVSSWEGKMYPTMLRE